MKTKDRIHFGITVSGNVQIEIEKATQHATETLKANMPFKDFQRIAESLIEYKHTDHTTLIEGVDLKREPKLH